MNRINRAISSQLLGLIDELLSRNPLVLCIGVVRDISAIQAEYRRAGRYVSLKLSLSLSLPRLALQL